MLLDVAEKPEDERLGAVTLFLEDGYLVRRGILLIEYDVQETFHFDGGALRNIKKAHEFPPMIPGKPLGDVRHDRDCGTGQLVAEPKVRPERGGGA